MQKREKNYYVDDEKLLEHMIVYRKKYIESLEKGLDKPRLSEYTGKCIMDTAINLAKKREYRNYPFKDEMIEYGIENAVAYIHNFNPDVGVKPFNYLTTIITYAFFRIIAKEKKLLYTKYKSILNFNLEATLNDQDFSEMIVQSESTLEKMYDFIKDYEEKKKLKKKKADAKIQEKARDI